MDIVNEEDVTAIDAKEIMNKREKEGELVYEQKICLEYLDKVIHIKNVEELVEELKKITILRPRHIALIVNILPDTEDEVNMLFSKELVNLKKDEINQIVEAVKKFKK